jgi:hypothetical protein
MILDPERRSTMFHLHKENAPAVNGGAINGRGVKHLKLTRGGRISQAADVATGVKQIDLSLGQICSVFDVAPAALRAELRARGVGGNDFSQEFRRWVEAWNGLSPAERKQAVQNLGELIHKS